MNGKSDGSWKGWMFESRLTLQQDKNETLIKNIFLSVSLSERYRATHDLRLEEVLAQ